MSSKTLLDELELPLAQCIDVEDGQALVRHAVPALDGDFLQPTGRRAGRVAVTGVVAASGARDGLEALRGKLRRTEPVDFVADIATATRTTRVLVEALDVREVAGKPERFEYAFLLREYNAPVEPGDKPRVDEIVPVDPDTGILSVEVIVEGEPDFDMGRVTVSADGPAEGAATSRVLTERESSVWTLEELPPGDFTVRASVADPPLAAAETATVRAGQTAKVVLRLVRAPGVARAFVVSFRFDSAFVEPCMRAVLRRAAAYAAAHPSERLVVVGHTDKTGSPEYNQSLSERRARAVFASLNFGVDPDRSVDEWMVIRAKRMGPGAPSVQDHWEAREYQQMLQELGFYPGRIDGQHGPMTNEAVRAFRCHKGLPPGTGMDDAVWEALIRDYLGDRPPTVARDRLMANCAATKLEWLGCGEQDPVKNTEAAHRPNRRVELLFVTDAVLPCAVPVPATWALPAPASGEKVAEWCLGGGDPARRACFVSREKPAPPRWRVEPAEPAVITAAGTIRREVERPDGSVDTVPAGGTRFVLVAPDGEFRAGELGSGEPAPAQAAADGSFSFAGKRAGVYALEVQDTVLARLAGASALPATGPTVCKALASGADRLDVILLRDPVLREVRLPVVVHRMTALHPGTRAVRTCPESLDPSVVHEQRTARDEAAVRALFDAANRIWEQARVRWEVRDVVPESFATVGRDGCHVSEDERNGIFADAATPGVLDLFLFGSMEVSGEAGVHVVGKLVDGADVTLRTFEAVAMGDRVLLKLFANADPVERTPGGPESEVILAHELGHYLALGHATGSGAAAERRLMLPSESPENRRLTADEVRAARASDNARDCGRIAVEVSGAARFGGALGHRFAAIRDAAAAPVAVDAGVPASMLNAAGSAFVMTGGGAGAGPTQRLVPRDAAGRFEVIARWTGFGGAPVSETYAAVHVLDFDVTVDGARALGNGRFLAIRDAAGSVAVRAVLFPEPVSIPRDLAAWTGGEETVDPLRRRVPLAKAGETKVSVTVAGVTKTVTVVVAELSLKVQGAEELAPAQFAAAQDPAGEVEVEAVFTPPVPDAVPDLVQWTGGQAGPGPRIRIVSKQAVAITPVLAQVGAAQQQATINVIAFTLEVAGATRVGGPEGDHFVVVAAPGKVVTVTAKLDPQPNSLPAVEWKKSGQPVLGMPRQLEVPAAVAGQPVTVKATVAGTAHSVTIHVVTFSLQVQNATAIGTPAGSRFGAVLDPGQKVIVNAVVTPALSPVPADLVTWGGDTTTDAGPTQRTFPRFVAGTTNVTATVAGVVRSVAVEVCEMALTTSGTVATGVGEEFATVAAAEGVTVDAVFTPAFTVALPASFVQWQGGQAVVGNALQRRVGRAAKGRFPVKATVTATMRTVNVTVAEFTLPVAGAVRAGDAASTEWFAQHDAAVGSVATVEAHFTPPPAGSLPPDALVWTPASLTGPDGLHRTVSRGAIARTAVTATIAGTTRTANVTIVQVEVTRTAGAAAAAATSVQVGLWDNAFDENTGKLRNGVAEVDNFVGSDTRRFYFRVRDPSANGGEVAISWRTRFDSGTDDDAPASQRLSLLETAPGSHVFVSRAVMLVTDDDDRNQATNSGLPGGHPQAGSRARGTSNHRLRKITVDAAHPLQSEVFAAYTPPGATAPAATMRVPVFERKPDERRRIRVHMVNVRTAKGGTGILTTARRNSGMAALRSVYARCGIFAEVNEIMLDPPAACTGWAKRFPTDPRAIDPSVDGQTAGVGTYILSGAMTALTTAVRALKGFDPDDIYLVYLAFIYKVPLPIAPQPGKPIPPLQVEDGGLSYADLWTTAASGARGFAFLALYSGISKYADPHETTHITTNFSHYDLGPAGATAPGNIDGRNLMHRFFLAAGAGVRDPKRLWDTAAKNPTQGFTIPAQVTTIRASRFVHPY